MAGNPHGSLLVMAKHARVRDSTRLRAKENGVHQQVHVIPKGCVLLKREPHLQIRYCCRVKGVLQTKTCVCVQTLLNKVWQTAANQLPHRSGSVDLTLPISTAQEVAAMAGWWERSALCLALLCMLPQGWRVLCVCAVAGAWAGVELAALVSLACGCGISGAKLVCLGLPSIKLCAMHCCDHHVMPLPL
jgi:hypothetical protein